MTDVVYIRGLRVAAVIGVHPWERTLRQTLVFDLELASDAAVAAASDALADALDYDAVSRRVWTDQVEDVPVAHGPLSGRRAR